jgi:hypothetical protein
MLQLAAWEHYEGLALLLWRLAQEMASILLVARPDTGAGQLLLAHLLR